MGLHPNSKAMFGSQHVRTNPLDCAVQSRDKHTLDMVEAALRHKETMLAFQPIVARNTPNKAVMYEGLIRVLDATGRIIPAKDFMPVVEDLEIGRMIDCVALELGLQSLTVQPDLRLSINMSARSVGYQPWMRTLETGLRADPTVGERLILEITESSAMLLPEVVISFMAQMQNHGIAFAMDDFGAGYTSFRYLRDFMFDIIKIDGTFIRGVARDPDNQVLLAALMSIAEQFDMLTIAESIETVEDDAYLRATPIDCLQGYFYGAPTISPPWRQTDRKRARSRRTA
ncbi:EAL domain-containing protein [Nereida sp. MMG025]|uniref:EAL domain-containing protein n=1 Tax=Nereida sp. MMG025 TaxID=2909981 RepID=UPI001F36C23A|nr:EAL domain-containing protein [Nereida sp. MMG025]MCF6444353.1 EAL domain-containing protein [Nereida sp. MMG025]